MACMFLNRTRAILLIVSGLLSTPRVGFAQTVHSVGVYSMGRTHEDTWTVGSGALRFGFEQYRQYQDADGNNLFTFTDVIARGVACPRYTTLFVGPAQFTVRGPMSLATLLAGVAMVTVFWFVRAVARGYQERMHGS